MAFRAPDPGLGPERVGRGPPRDHEEPGPTAGVAAESRQGAIRPDEGVLDHVVEVVRVDEGSEEAGDFGLAEPDRIGEGQFVTVTRGEQ